MSYQVRLIHPHKYWNFQCGMFVKHGPETLIFLGYCADNLTGMLADQHGNKRVVYLNEIATA